MVTELEVKPFCIGIDGVSVTVNCKTDGVAVVAEPDADGKVIVVIKINLTQNKADVTHYFNELEY